jgi:hypothetical protein
MATRGGAFYSASGTTSPLLLLIYSTLARNRATYKPLSGNLNQLNQVSGTSSAEEEEEDVVPDGGAVYVSGGALHTGLCVLDDNQAANRGGAMYLQDGCSLVGARDSCGRCLPAWG